MSPWALESTSLSFTGLPSSQERLAATAIRAGKVRAIGASNSTADARLVSWTISDGYSSFSSDDPGTWFVQLVSDESGSLSNWNVQNYTAGFATYAFTRGDWQDFGCVNSNTDCGKIYAPNGGRTGTWTVSGDTQSTVPEPFSVSLAIGGLGLVAASRKFRTSVR